MHATNTSTDLVVEGSKRQRRKPILKWTAIMLSILVVLAAGGTGYGYRYIYKDLPVVKGTLSVPGLQGAVTVWRDDHGVPHIEAKNEHDLFLAQGYVTAQDRLFQMDLSRRQASGELSEVIGKQTVDTDKFFRTFGLRRAAEASLSAYDDQDKQILEWYAQGVNVYMQQAESANKLPIEFRLLGYKPKPWTPIDSLTIGKYMAYDLGGHWESQVFRYYLTQQFPQDKALDLFPSYPKDGATIIQALKDTPKLNLDQAFASVDPPNPFNGSNDWVVSGSKTATGKPILANDPHLGLATPSIWYETQLKTDDMDVSGVIFAGVPGIILGHNQQVAWGVTNVGPDVQDLYIEKRNPDNANQFQYMGKWEQAQVIQEPIKVKGQADIPYQVVVTRHGPIISEFAGDSGKDTALSLKWTALQPSTELEAIQGFMHAKNWEDFKQALTKFDTPAQNFVFAAEDGTIAYRANGLIPIRKNGDGLTPVPGWTDEYEWTGYIPWDQLPTIVNPPQGFIATANNKVIGDQYPYHISNIWAEPYREQRIQQVLSSKSSLTVNDMEQLQFDHLNLQAQEFLQQMLKQIQASSNKNALRPIDQDAIQVLQTWNDQDDSDAAAPLIFNLWMQHLPSVLFQPEISDTMLKFFEDEASTVDELLRHAFAGQPGPWIQSKGGLTNVLTKSLQAAVDEASSLQGTKVSTWKWGSYHAVEFPHPLSAVKPLNLLFNFSKPVPMGGSRVTVGAAGWDPTTGEVDHGAPWRTVVDLSAMTESHSVVGPGQSGNVFSPWYNDQVGDWTTGKYHVTNMDPSVYQKSTNKLVLQP